MNTSRRNFLKQIGGIPIGLGLSTWILDSLHSSPNYNEVDFLKGLGIETRVNSLCSLCECGCGISVRLIDDVPVKIGGNKLHPLNKGGVCVRGLTGLELVYNPDRISGPLKRVGYRGSRQWERITWNEALETLTQKLTTNQQSRMTNNMMFLVDGIMNPLNDLLKRFVVANGSSHYYTCGFNPALPIQNQVAYGGSQELAYDLENTNFILSFGAQFLESEPALGWYERMYGHIRRGRQGNRAQIVQIDPQRSITAIKADNWIRINPGTYGAVALGIAHLLIREKQYDEAFINKYTFGFENWKDNNGNKHIGFKNLVLTDYSPKKVEAITGIAPYDLVQLTNEFASSKTGLAVAGSRCAWYANGSQTLRAVHSLNALMGNIGTTGGIVPRKQIPLTPLKAVDTTTEWRDKDRLLSSHGSGQDRQISADSLAAILTDADHDNQIETLFIYKANPLHHAANKAELLTALNGVPFIVSFSSFLDETTQHADLILPDHAYLEKMQAAVSPPNIASVHIGLSHPVMKPLYDTKDVADVIIQLSQKIGGKLGEYFPWKNYEEYLRVVIRGIFESEQGTIFTEAYDKAWVTYLRERGWRYSSYTSFDEFWNDMIKKGGWWDPEFREPAVKFKTPSKKFEFYSLTLKQHLQVHQNRSDNKPDELYLPNYQPVSQKEAAKTHRFKLNPFLLTTIGAGEGANQPTLMEILGIHVKQRWTTWVEINPEDAHELGVQDREWVWLVSDQDKLKIQARVYSGASPGIVNVPLGLGHNGYGRFADKRGINPLSLFRTAIDPISGLTSLLDTNVSIERA